MSAIESEPAVVDSPEDRVRILAALVRRLNLRLEAFRAFVAAQERWEADAILDDSPWFDEMPKDLREAFDKLQELRNRAVNL